MTKKDFLADPQGSTSKLFQATLIKSGFPVSKLAEALGKSEDLIYKYANPHCDTQNIKLWEAVVEMAITEDFTILQDLARLFGYALIPLNGDPLAAVKALVEELEKK